LTTNQDKKQQSQQDGGGEGGADEGIVNSVSIQAIPLTFTDLLSK
jgi:hypothetical protein